MRLASCSPPPERRCLVARCRRLLELRSAGAKRLDPNNWPPGTGEGSQDLGEECAVLRAAAEDLSQGVRTELLRQILDAFTDTQRTLLSLVRAALATPPGSAGCDVKASPPSLQLLLAAFRAQAKRMLSGSLRLGLLPATADWPRHGGHYSWPLGACDQSAAIFLTKSPRVWSGQESRGPAGLA